MLTSRAWWFLFLAVATLLAGTIDVQGVALPGSTPLTLPGLTLRIVGLTLIWLRGGSTPLTLLGLTLLLWFGGAWLIFALRIPLAVRRLRFSREVRDERGPVTTLWAGRSYDVRVRLVGRGPLTLPLVFAADRPP